MQEIVVSSDYPSLANYLDLCGTFLIQWRKKRYRVFFLALLILRILYYSTTWQIVHASKLQAISRAFSFSRLAVASRSHRRCILLLLRVWRCDNQNKKREKREKKKPRAIRQLWAYPGQRRS